MSGKHASSLRVGNQTAEDEHSRSITNGVKKQPKILSRCQIKHLIAQGKAIVIYKNNVLNLTSWLSKHPGGEKAVYHMIGRDATDEMLAYHSPESIATFTRWKVGQIDYYWENLLPPIQGAIYTENDLDDKVLPTQTLESKLDGGSSSNSDVDLASSASSTSSVSDHPRTKPDIHSPQSLNKGLGFPQGHIEANKNHIVSKENKDHAFPIKKDYPIVDPKELMNNYDNTLAQRDLLGLPDMDYPTQQNLRNKYYQLHDQVIKLNMYQCDYWSYVRECVKIASLVLYSLSFLKLKYYATSAVLMGLAWHQGTFIAHDAGHVSITHNYQIDNLFGMLIADFFGGLSLGWWKRNHNVHHLITNDPVHDPDIQHLPFFAVSVKLFNGIYSTYYDKYLPLDVVAQKLIPLQRYMYYPILCFGRFNLYRLSWMHVINGDGPRRGKAAWFRYFELLGLSFFFYWFFYLIVGQTVEGLGNKVKYVLISHVATMLVHVQITLSHFAMSTSDLGVSESFPSRQLRTTMDVDCPEWLDFLHGGLQFQAIHHLFPRLPRHNLRKVQPFVLDFCREVGLPYSIYGFGKGNEIIIGKLGEIGKQCQIMLDCTKVLPEVDH